MAALDCTVWPADGNYLAEALRTLCGILAMSCNNMGFVQYPLLTSQTSLRAVIRHCHLRDNDMVKFNLTPYHKIQVRYSKPDSSARDNRSLNQEARAVFHSNFDVSPWQDGAAVRDGVLGPCPLLRIADFVGYDECRRPGASARELNRS